MNFPRPQTEGRLLHVVTLQRKDDARTAQRIAALASYGGTDALACSCISYEFGLTEGASDTVLIVEHWNGWQDLDTLLATKIVPALPMYNPLLKRPFDPAKDRLRIRLSTA
jgi:quinol monooxygenase YgiN